MINFYLDSKSGITPYLQLVQQVRRAVLLGQLRVGDQLPTVKSVVESVTINPNTVSKAYRELETEGLVTARVGVGTFVTGTLELVNISAHEPLRQRLGFWMSDALESGLGVESIEALFAECLQASTSVGAN